MPKKITGFTLIELLIVVAIIAILAAVSIVVYQDMSTRARIAEGLGLVTDAKVAVAETVFNNNALPANQAATGYETPPPTNNVSNISIGANGIITITFSANAGGGTVIFQPTVVNNSHLNWDCTGGTVPLRHRPAICR